MPPLSQRPLATAIVVGALSLVILDSRARLEERMIPVGPGGDLLEHERVFAGEVRLKAAELEVARNLRNPRV